MKSVLFYTLVAAQLYYFHAHYDLRQDSPALRQMADTIREHTRPDDVILIYGMEWDSSLAYYAQRKAVMFPASLMTPQQIAAASGWAERIKIGAIVRCDGKGCEIELREPATNRRQ